MMKVKNLQDNFSVFMFISTVIMRDDYSAEM